MNKLSILLFSILVLAGSCKKEVKNHNAPDVLVTNRDTTANLSDDFFQYANGSWFKKIQFQHQKEVMEFLEQFKILLIIKSKRFVKNQL
ncbi:hypothetical protein [Flavobacterium oreochromis]|uniref:hypothetical protein n=1 Tax=Flavobacterium oreochromis TaxID=2906078 RepID=UPI002164B3A5|nr:hypothetical protein [Flavobacterium oreochromis]